jgi:hypothetical protein
MSFLILTTSSFDRDSVSPSLSLEDVSSFFFLPSFFASSFFSSLAGSSFLASSSAASGFSFLLEKDAL